MVITFFKIFERTIDNGILKLDVPDGTICAMCLFEPYPKAPWALCGYAVDPRRDCDGQMESNLTPELIDTLCAAIKYPPALALARESAFCLTPTQVNKEDYCREVESLLKTYLKDCQSACFLMARAVGSEGDTFCGSYYWIVGYDETHDKVEYVTDEYYVLSARSANFDVSRDELLKVSRQVTLKGRRPH